MKTYYDGVYAGNYDDSFPRLDTSQEESWWGSSRETDYFQGYQKDLVIIKGRALPLSEVRQVQSLTGEGDGVSMFRFIVILI